MSDYIPPDEHLQAVVFDLDGLMFDTEVLYQEVGREVLSRRGKQISNELLDEMMGRQSDKALQIMIDWHELDDTVQQLADESMEIMYGLLATRLNPMPGLLALLESLEHAGIPKAIATSSRRVFVDHVLELSQMSSNFDFVLTSEDIEHGKPEPDIYLLAARRHKCEPHRVLVLEDSQIGCQAAVAAGTYAVAVPSGRTHEHSFEGVKFVAASLQDERIYRVLGLPCA